MKLDDLLKEMMSPDINQDQRNFALSQGGLSSGRPAPSVEQVELDAIKNILNHMYRPNEYSVGSNGSNFDITVGSNVITGSFDKVLKSCVEIVVRPQKK